ncbi:hypothetical protein WG66_014750 [Moniliophthora roreri]|nr:hypothetical protein WG66_014750 [Moniliophthora roreri]
MASLDQLPPGFLDNTYGAELLGCIAATALWGIQCLQTFMYFQTYAKDHWILKFLVIWIWVMDTVHQGLVISLEYITLIEHFGDPSPLFEINKEVTLSILFTVFVSVPIQIFFVYRIYVLGGRNIILPFILVRWPLATVTNVIDLGNRPVLTSILFFGFTCAPDALPTDLASGSVRDICLSYLVLAAAIDVAIAVAMVYLLRKTKIEGVSQTQRMVARLTMYSVHTGLWTALLSIFVAVTVRRISCSVIKAGKLRIEQLVAYPTTFIFIALYVPISALYCNTLLANLNLRQHVRSGMKDVITLSMVGNGPSAYSATLAASHTERGTERGGFAVRMTTSTVIDGHEDSQHDTESHRKLNYHV